MTAEYTDYRESHPNASNVFEDSDIPAGSNEQMQVLMRTLSIKKGKCPEEAKGIYHKLMKLAYIPRRIETIFELGDNDLLYLFYTNCVSQSVGKRKWNQHSKTRQLSSFVSPTDEAFAMLVIENNVAKWMNELRFGKNRNETYQYKSLYTEGKTGRQWNQAGKKRFVYLLKICKEYRVLDEKKEIYKTIQNMILERERATSTTQNNYEENNESNSGDDEEDEDDTEIEAELLAMANGVL